MSYALKCNNMEPAKADAPIISSSTSSHFKSKLTGFKYSLKNETEEHVQFKYTGSKSWGLLVEIENNQISFTAPLTKSYNSNLEFECLQTASELCDCGKLAIYHEKNKEWINLNTSKTHIKSLLRKIFSLALPNSRRA